MKSFTVLRFKRNIGRMALNINQYGVERTKKAKTDINKNNTNYKKKQ